jgi:hypothetical protein
VGGREPGAEALERDPDLDDVVQGEVRQGDVLAQQPAQRVAGHGGDRRASGRTRTHRRPDHALSLEGADRLAHGCPADVQHPCQLAFGWQVVSNA